MRSGKRFMLAAVALLLFLWGIALIAGQMERATFQDIMSSPMTQQDRGVKLLNWYSNQLSQGLPLTDAEKDLYLELDSQYDADRGLYNSLDNQGGPDAFQYMFRDNVAPDDVPYNWIELRGDAEATWIGGLTHFTSIDDGYSRQMLPIGFSFPFYGANYDCVRVATNGFLQFTTTSTSLSNACLPSTGIGGPAICVLWDDLHLFRGGQADTIVIGYRNFGTHFVIQFDNIGWYTTSCPNVPLKFEAILYPNGNIKLQYNTVTRPAAACQNTQTIGIQANGAAGSAALNYVCNTTGFQPNDGLAIEFARATGIPNPPSNFTGAFVSGNVVLNWTDPSQDTQGNPLTPQNLQVWWGAVETGTLLATLNAGVQTYTHTAPPAGNHTYNVRAYNAPYYGSAATVSVIVGNPTYNNNFNTDNGMWVPTPETGGFAWGAPTNTSAPAPYSVPNYWGTGLTANYGNTVDYFLDLNLGLVVQSPTASVEFWFRFDTEQTFDGANFKASVDDGATWTVLTPTEGTYTVTAISTLNTFMTGQPAWSGHMQTAWQRCVIPIGTLQGQAPIFRFEFSSDGSVSNYAGFFFDDMIIWGLATPQSATVSGTVTFDGLGGTMTAVQIRSNGLGSPTANPAANGSYSLSNVQVGNRTIIASLAGYHPDTNAIAVPAGGLTNVNFVLRRVNPPAPTGLTGSVNSSTGLVTLNWDDSPDQQVDVYRVYRKPRTGGDWTLRFSVIGRTNSQGTETLTQGGIYQYRVTAVDTNVIAPVVESDPSSMIEVSYGAIPPHSLAADTAYDDRIRLTWMDPLAPPETELFYDNGENGVQGIGFWGATTPLEFGWLVTKYTRPGSVTITRIKHFFTPDARVGDVYQVGVFADSTNGRPSLLVQGMVETNIPAAGDWHVVTLPTPVTIPTGVFYIGARQMAPAPPSICIGGDTTTAFQNLTYFYCGTSSSGWSTYEPNLITTPMQRCIVQTSGGQEIELRPDMPTSPLTAIRPIVAGWQTGTAFEKRLNVSNDKKQTFLAADVPSVRPIQSWSDLQTPRSTRYAVAHMPKQMPYGASDRDGRSLDDVIRYIVYRNGVPRDSVLGTVYTYSDIVGSANENVAYTYAVAARYDNLQLSPQTSTVTGRAGMPPAAPSNGSWERVGETGIRLHWTDPTLNADSTTCVDLTGIKVYRDNTLIATVNPGVGQYLDQGLTPATHYHWALVAVDEIPNYGPALDIFGVAGTPSYFNNFETDNGGWVANPAAGGWEWGQPTFASGPAAYSGTNVWGTVLAGAYTNSACWDIQLNLGLIVGQANASVEFQAWWACENVWDGWNFQVSVDNGSTWTLITPEGGYTSQTSNNTCIGTTTPNYTNTTTGNFWHTVIFPIGQFQGQTPIFKILFGSDASVTYPGVYIDDMIIWGMQPVSSITGIVREFGTNTPLQGAEVSVPGVAGPVTSDATGNYTLGIGAGTYSVLFTHPTHCDTTYANVVVEEGSQTVRNAVMKKPIAQISATSLDLIAPIGQQTTGTFTIGNPGGQCDLEYAISDTSAWLSAAPANGTVAPNQTVTITVTANAAGLLAGDYTSPLRVVYNAAGTPAVIPVVFHVGVNAGEHDPVPTEFAYHSNYPNPFNAITSLRFDVPQESLVEIAIFNVMGQEVARPVDNFYAPGRYNVTFNAGELPSGMYLVRMTAGSFSQVGKMMLLK